MPWGLSKEQIDEMEQHAHRNKEFDRQREADQPAFTAYDTFRKEAESNAQKLTIPLHLQGPASISKNNNNSAKSDIHRQRFNIFGFGFEMTNSRSPRRISNT